MNLKSLIIVPVLIVIAVTLVNGINAQHEAHATQTNDALTAAGIDPAQFNK